MQTPLFLLSLATLLLISCGSSTNKPLYPAQAPTGAETSLSNEINQVRRTEGKKPFTRSAKLDALAASESARLAASGSRRPNISSLRSRAGYSQVAVIVGALKDRGPKTGASYPSYWMKSPREKGYLLDDWHRLGVGTAKSPDGELVSIVIFGDIGGASLMNPM